MEEQSLRDFLFSIRTHTFCKVEGFFIAHMYIKEEGPAIEYPVPLTKGG